MKVFITLLFSFLLHTASAQYKLADSITKKYKYVFPSNLSGYYFVRNKKEKTGLIDSVGNVQIKLMFEYIGRFENGSAEAGNYVGKKFQRGIINFTGKITVPFMYNYIFRYCADKCIVEKNGKNGVIDNYNKIWIPLKYEDVYDANENTLIVQENKKYGFVREDGKAITKIIYKKVDRFYNKTAAVVLEDNSGTAINLEGDELFKPIKNIEFVQNKNGLLLAYNIITKKIGLCNEAGKLLIPVEYDQIELMGKFIKARKKEMCGLLDLENKIKIPFEYNFFYEAFENQFICSKGTLNSVVDADNKIIIPQKYNSIQFLGDKYYFVKSNTELNGVIDINGKEIIPAEYKFYGVCGTKIFATKNKEKHILDLENLDKNIKVEVDSFKEVYYNWFYGKECYQIAFKNKKCGIIDIDNNIKIPFEYDEIRFMDGKEKFIAKQNGKYGIVDINNKIIQEIVYDRIVQQKEAVSFYKDGKRVTPSTLR